MNMGRRPGKCEQAVRIARPSPVISMAPRGDRVQTAATPTASLASSRHAARSVVALFSRPL